MVIVKSSSSKFRALGQHHVASSYFLEQREKIGEIKGIELMGHTSNLWFKWPRINLKVGGKYGSLQFIYCSFTNLNIYFLSI